MGVTFGKMNTTEGIESFVRRIHEALDLGEFIELQFKHGKSSSRCSKLRLVEIKGTKKLSAQIPQQSGVVTRNFEIPEALCWIREEIQRHCAGGFLRTMTSDWQLDLTRNNRARLIRHQPSCKTLPTRAHDLPKEVALDRSALALMEALGIVTHDGVPKTSKGSKYRQIQRYAELVGHLLGSSGIGQKGDRPFQVFDYGSGKAYLTFALWHRLRLGLGCTVCIRGVERRLDLVDQCNGLVDTLDAHGLRFVQGDIESVPADTADMVVALHACDTATDAAIGQGVRAGAKWLLIAPCCQHQLRPQIATPGVLQPLLRHGIMTQRISDWLTDSLRALYLELVGYEVRIMEFIESEHTPKNLLIVAEFKRQPEPKDRQLMVQRILSLKREFGIEFFALDQWISLGTEPSLGIP